MTFLLLKKQKNTEIKSKRHYYPTGRDSKSVTSHTNTHHETGTQHLANETTEGCIYVVQTTDILQSYPSINLNHPDTVTSIEYSHRLNNYL